MRHLTSTNPELERLARLTPKGMAHWASSGPINTTCGECAHLLSLKRKQNRCAEFYRMMGVWGGFIPRATPSCQHFTDLGEVS